MSWGWTVVEDEDRRRTLSETNVPEAERIEFAEEPAMATTAGRLSGSLEDDDGTEGGGGPVVECD